jgi:hypothetical protein
MQHGHKMQHGNEARRFSREMQHGIQHGHAACTCSMEKRKRCILDMQLLNEPSTCSKDMQQGPAAWTGCKDMQIGQAAGTCSMSILHGEAVRTCRKVVQQENSYEHAAWTCYMYIRAACPCLTDMLHVHTVHSARP